MENNATHGANERVYHISWVAYIRPIAVFIIVFLIVQAFRDPRNTTLNIIVYVLLAGLASLLVMRLIYLKTMRLVINDDGVYLFSGIFPWTKGMTGTLWRDVAEATYYTGFISWAFNSYRICVRHRFTKTSELMIPSVKNGNKAAMEINGILSRKFINVP
ncbi:hypothetical protein [Enterobacter cloacae]|uniref:hypothetical protein n=1 Tax=Enterobacter cloacae TaxID=550 RepID=UPI002FF923E9